MSSAKPAKATVLMPASAQAELLEAWLTEVLDALNNN